MNRVVLALGAVLAMAGCETPIEKVGDEQVEWQLVELDRPAMLAKVGEAHDMSARLRARRNADRRLHARGRSGNR